jgi:hypothetical protein
MNDRKSNPAQSASRALPRGSREPASRRVQLRFPSELWEELEAQRDRLAAERPGARVTVTDAIRELLWRGLSAADHVPEERPREVSEAPFRPAALFLPSAGQNGKG